jgi:transcriptional regulator with XRE-family HTH domain
MTTAYASFIKDLREARGLSQALVAKEIGMSRASYVALEKGTKELTLAEAQAVVKLFSITIDELLAAQVPNAEKYKQMIRAYLREAKGSGKTLKKTKLANLLYLADFAWYYTHQESMSGMTYRKLEFGPVPDAYFSTIEEMERKGEINVTQVARNDYHMYEIEETRASEKGALSLLTKKELNLIQSIWKRWEDAKTEEIVRFTHEQSPYRDAEENGNILYELIMKEDPLYIF